LLNSVPDGGCRRRTVRHDSACDTASTAAAAAATASSTDQSKLDQIGCLNDLLMLHLLLVDEIGRRADGVTYQLFQV
jgi:hypothetical protein